jgi:hypothetical protein
MVLPINKEQRKYIDDLVEKYDDSAVRENQWNHPREYLYYSRRVYDMFTELEHHGFEIPDVYQPLYSSLKKRLKS